jgi:hypothetical protein
MLDPWVRTLGTSFNNIEVLHKMIIHIEVFLQFYNGKPATDEHVQRLMYLSDTSKPY